MKSSRFVIAFAALVSLVALGAGARTVSGPAQHGIALRGTITALDDKAHTLSIKDSKGATVDLTWNDATKLNGAPLKIGEMVSVRYMEKSGQRVATVIAVPQTRAAAKPPVKR